MFPALLAADERPMEAVSLRSVTAEALCAEVPRLRRLVHRLLGWRASASDLDDVVQDVLLKAWQKRHGFRGDAALATWLVAIALSTARDHTRRRVVRDRLFGWFLPTEPAAPAGSAAAIDADEPLDATRRALQQLPHQDREVLVLRYLEQRSIDEIQPLLGISRAALDQRLSRARQRLRVALGLPRGGGS